MFDNVGKKIKEQVVAHAIIEILIWILIGTILICCEAHLVLAGLLVIGIGSYISLTKSLYIYAYGELVHKTSLIERYLRNKSSDTDTMLETQTQEKTKDEYRLNSEFTTINKIPTGSKQTGSCDMCFKKTDVANCKIGNIPNEYKLCLDCINKYKATIEE